MNRDNQFIQPSGTRSCALYAMANFLGEYVLSFEKMALNGLNLTQENFILSKVLDNIGISRFMCSNSYVCYLETHQVKAALHYLQQLKELESNGNFIICPISVKVSSNLLHRVYLYVYKDHFRVSDPVLKEVYTLDFDSCLNYLCEKYSVEEICVFFQKDENMEELFFCTNNSFLAEFRETEQVRSSRINDFFSRYNSQEDIVDKCYMLFDFIDQSFLENKAEAKKALLYLLLRFNDQVFHSSEIKTVLVISKPFKEDTLLKEAREDLLVTYNLKRKSHE